MRVLTANIPLPLNRFLTDLNAELGKQATLTHDEQRFWHRQGEFDVVHLHFPEYMTFAHEQAYESGLTEDLIRQTEDCLSWWAQRSRIVITRHVLLPHDALRNPQWEKMYEAVYRHVHAVVHFASASIDEFRERYGDTKFAHGEPLHAVIPHHNYESLPNKVSREDARQHLGIAVDRKVMLVFGAIRNFEEARLILNTFQGLRIPRKLLLVSRWKEQLANVRCS